MDRPGKFEARPSEENWVKRRLENSRSVQRKHSQLAGLPSSLNLSIVNQVSPSPQPPHAQTNIVYSHIFNSFKKAECTQLRARNNFFRFRMSITIFKHPLKSAKKPYFEMP